MAVIAHELRNSLSVVRNAAQLIGTQQTVSGVLDSARLLIERQVGQMSRFIEDLLDGSWVARPECLKRQRIDLRVLLMQVMEGLELDFGRRGHRLTVHLPHDPVWLDADPGRLEQVFSNLLTNAAKYFPDRGDITLTVERRLEHASVRISDTGIGISPKTAAGRFRALRAGRSARATFPSGTWHWPRGGPQFGRDAWGLRDRCERRSGAREQIHRASARAGNVIEHGLR
jgi:signal transduction histidine kinase